MKQFLLAIIIASLPLTLFAEPKKIILTKNQLICLKKEIKKYLEENSKVIFIILKSSCDINNTKKEHISLKNTLPNPDDIKVDSNSSSAISINDILSLSKDELLCLEKKLKNIPLKEDKIEVELQCN